MDWNNISPVALIVALVGTAGAGAFFREIADVFSKLRSGMSARESKRKVDIVQQRDEAVRRAAAADERADAEAVKRRLSQEYASLLRRRLIENGIEPDEWPVLEKSITLEELDALRTQPKE